MQLLRATPVSLALHFSTMFELLPNGCSFSTLLIKASAFSNLGVNLTSNLFRHADQNGFRIGVVSRRILGRRDVEDSEGPRVVKNNTYIDKSASSSSGTLDDLSYQT